MKKAYNIKKKSSLKENIRQVLPEMFDDFFAHYAIVINFPLRKSELHEMRKAGKPLRYAMELGEYCFHGDFKLCLDEIKSSLELMGEVHDADVMIPDINLHIKEIRLFNQTISDPDQRFSTKELRNYITNLRAKRRELYAELCTKFNLWNENDFRIRIVNAVNLLK